jgi:hypothetical protein
MAREEALGQLQQERAPSRGPGPRSSSRRTRCRGSTGAGADQHFARRSALVPQGAGGHGPQPAAPGRGGAPVPRGGEEVGRR